MIRKLSKADKCRNLMYKRSMIADINYVTIHDDLWDMQAVCSDIHYAFDDDETLINAFDGNEDEAYEFRLSFSDLDAEIEKLLSDFDEMYGFTDDPEKEFDDMTVSLLGEWFRLLGFDAYRGDFFEFDYAYSSEIAHEESRKRTMRRTKKEILDKVGLTMSFVLKYLDIKYRYDYLKAVTDIFRDENVAVLKLVKSIDEKYKELFNKANGEMDDYVSKTRKAREAFDSMVNQLPEKYWVE